MAITLDTSVLPNEMILEIFSHLVDARDLGQCLFVSRLWCHLASNDQLWKVVLPRLAPGATLPAKGLLDFLQSHAVLSKEGVAQRLVEFTHNARWFLNNSFVCFFPFNTRSEVTVGLGFTLPQQYENKEICIFMRTLSAPVRRQAISKGIGHLHSFIVSLPADPNRLLDISDSLNVIYARELTIPLSMAQVSQILKTGAEKLKNDASVTSAAVVAVAAAVLGQLQTEDLPD